VRRQLSAIVVALAALAAAPTALAAEQRTTLSAGESIPRERCDQRLLEGEPGVATQRFEPSTGGLLTAALEGTRFSDWDLALFDRDGRLLGASNGFGAAERALARVAPGSTVTVQACRRFGSESDVPLTLDVFEVPRHDGGTPAQLVEVAIGDEADHQRLEATGLDVTHDHRIPGPGVDEPGYAKVVLYSPLERVRLMQAGFAPTTVIADMRGADLADRTRELRAADVGIASALPSGRETYREPQDYAAELKALAEANPGLVRKVTLPLPSLEGRPIEGVEIAAGVNRSDDGRPVYVQLGLHHAREWPSGEFPLEFALDLVQRFNAGDDRVTPLLGRVRVVILPLMNPDGFAVSRAAGPMPGADDDDDLTIGLALSDAGAYKRKNCRPNAPGDPTPCAARTSQGVDLNRNYGAFFGGDGSDGINRAAQNFRGAGPFSEPESEAFHRFSSGRQITNVISNHTFTDEGVFLRQPGFQADFFPENAAGEDISPDEAGMKELGDAMGLATGWESALGWKLSDITGATEDWNYFAQGAFGYTPEGRGPNFHANYQDWVVAEYEGKGALAGRGVREAFLLGAEQAANPRDHSVIAGRAPPGRVLRLTKRFDTRTSLEGIVVDDTLDTTLTVPGSGIYEWHVNPSKRPLFAEPGEAWEMTCETPDGTVLDRVRVDVGRGRRVERSFACVAADVGTASCDAPRRRVGPRSLDRVRLGQRRRTARQAYRGREGRRRSVERFCLTGRGSLRVGYPSRGLLRTLARRERGRVRSRVVLILSSSPAHRVRGVRAGSSRASLRRRFPRARRIRVGANTWHLVRGRRARLVYKVRGRRVGEVGLADARLTSTRRGAVRFLRSFR
jgi:hypothetical protein